MTIKLDPGIFRAYDIRGTVTGDNPQLTPALAERVGRALGTALQRDFGSDMVYVGRDNRPSSAGLQSAMIAGLIATGMDVTDIGEVLTPTVYFASASHGEAGAGVMITGSHLGVRYNGIKLAYGALAMAGEQITDLLDLVRSGEFVSGAGRVTQDHDMIRRHMAAIQGKVKMARPLTIVMDAGNGLSGTWVPPVLRALGLKVHCLYCESDGTYPNHLPNPEDPEMTRDLEAMVL
ncbi:MAG: phosphomannomutase/phosphoglucomutase, partial [Anaerolineaceae bacterium]|nr:phosphomannomutase/phosphoglucomutase [Anaerolineaceae bacterium]